MSALVSELPSCPSHETRDRQTHQGQTPNTGHCQGTQPHTAPELCAAAPLPSLEHRMGRSCTQGNVFIQKRMQHCLCSVLGWDPSLLHQRSRQRLFKHYKPCTVVPVGRCSPAVYFVCALVNQKRWRALSCALSSSRVRTSSGSALRSSEELRSSCLPQGGSHRGEVGQVGAALLPSGP